MSALFLQEFVHDVKYRFKCQESSYLFKNSITIKVQKTNLKWKLK